MNDIKFGTIDTETGETRDGYIDKSGKMCFKKPSWWQSFCLIFKPPPRETVYVGTMQGLEMQYIWSSQGIPVEGALYKVINPLTEKVYRLYAKTNVGCVDFDTEAFAQNNKLIIVR